ncbi:MFS transporter [Microbacterium sp. CJ88]|uniref:MFS transporter n=1 Tax=Microbacterium sp. CJ88 TaxID=3445672 RepID=UPI003F654C6E
MSQESPAPAADDVPLYATELAEEIPATTAADPVTPLGRLITAIMFSTAGAFGATLAPLQLLLTIHMVRIGGEGAAISFGFVAGAGAVAALVANPLAGRLSDRTTAALGRRRTWILTGATTGSLALAAVVFTTQVWQVVAVWAVVQAMFTVQTAATSALLADQVPPQRRGGVSGLMGLGLSIFPLVVLAVVSAVGDSPLQWAICVAVGLIGGVVAALLLRERPLARAAGAPRLTLKEVVGSYWLSPRRHPAFGWAWITRFLVYCSFATSTYTAFFLLDRFGLTTDDLGPIVLAIAGISILVLAVTSVAGGFLSDRLRRQKPFVFVGALLAATGLVLTVFAPSVEVLYLTSAMNAIGAGLMYSVDNALCVRMLPDAGDVGKDFGIINLANQLPTSIVPFVAPALLALGGFPALYLTLAALGLLGALTLLRLPEIGHEGDPRWAQITREPAPVA